MSSSFCTCCGRGLKDPTSIEKGIGSICAAKQAAENARAEAENENPVLYGVGNILDVGLVCKRLEGGRLACNILQIHAHHSPTGMECGYGGSGPADLALNVMAIFCPIDKSHMDEDLVKLYDGSQVSRRAWDLHQNFKRQYIAGLSKHGGTISAETIRKFIADNYVESLI